MMKLLFLQIKLVYLHKMCMFDDYMVRYYQKKFKKHVDAFTRVNQEFRKENDV